MRNLLFVIAVVAGSGAAHAGGSLEETRWRDSHDKNLKASIDEANQKCGSSITARFDWDTIKFDDWQKVFGAIGGNSEDYLVPSSVLQQLCMKDDGKTAVKKEIKTIVIKVGGDAPSVVLKDGELDDFITLKSSTHYLARRFILDYLEKHL